jgi:hypothetical protein
MIHLAKQFGKVPMDNELPKGAVNRALLLAILATFGAVGGAWVIFTLLRALR